MSDFDSQFVKLLKTRRSAAGDLYLTRTMADQLFRVMEINERILNSKEEIIMSQKRLIEMYRGESNEKLSNDSTGSDGSSDRG